MTRKMLIALLEIILRGTPDGQLFCVPLKRSTVAAILEALKNEPITNEPVA